MHIFHLFFAISFLGIYVF